MTNYIDNDLWTLNMGSGSNSKLLKLSVTYNINDPRSTNGSIRQILTIPSTNIRMLEVLMDEGSLLDSQVESL